jgi:hypothetical protein
LIADVEAALSRMKASIRQATDLAAPRRAAGGIPGYFPVLKGVRSRR